MSRRCVITGMGAVTPLGSTVASFWDGIKNGVCGIGRITKFDTTDYKVKIGAEVKGFDAEKYMGKKDIKRKDLIQVTQWQQQHRLWKTAGLKLQKRMP